MKSYRLIFPWAIIAVLGCGSASSLAGGLFSKHGNPVPTFQKNGQRNPDAPPSI
jgi:hypothetical protein